MTIEGLGFTRFSESLDDIRCRWGKDRADPETVPSLLTDSQIVCSSATTPSRDSERAALGVACDSSRGVASNVCKV